MLAPATLSKRSLLALCLAALSWGFSFGAGAPLASLWLQDAGCSATIIGLNTGIYYLGIAVAAGFVPWMMRRGGRGCLLAGMILSGVTVSAFPWGGSHVGWFGLRLLNGVAGAMSIIPVETLINRNSSPDRRSRNFGLYAFAMAGGIALGTLVGVPLYASAPRLAFMLGGLAGLLAAAAVLALEWPGLAEEPLDSRTPLALSRHLFSFGSAWSQGFLEGGMIALLPVYLLAIGLSDASVGWLMSGTMIGVISFQVPVAWLADRLGRTPVLLGCYGVTAAALAAVLFGVPLAGLALCLFFAGACSSAFYPLGLALLGERTPAAGLARANAWFLGINCLGSLIGPVLAGVAMDQFGNQALFAVGLAAVFLVPIACAARYLTELILPKGIVIAQDASPVATRKAA